MLSLKCTTPKRKRMKINDDGSSITWDILLELIYLGQVAMDENERERQERVREVYSCAEKFQMKVVVDSLREAYSNILHNNEIGNLQSYGENNNSCVVHKRSITSEGFGGDSYESILSEENYIVNEETDEDGDVAQDETQQDITFSGSEDFRHPPTPPTGDNNSDQDSSVSDIFESSCSVINAHKKSENVIDETQESVVNDHGYEFDHNVGDQTFTVDTPPDFVETFGNKSSTQHGKVLITRAEDVNMHLDDKLNSPSISVVNDNIVRASNQHSCKTSSTQHGRVVITGGEDFIMHVDDEYTLDQHLDSTNNNVNSPSTSVCDSGSAIRKRKEIYTEIYKEIYTALSDIAIRTETNKQNTGSEVAVEGVCAVHSNTVHCYEGGNQQPSEENDNSLPLHEECSARERSGGDSYESILSEENYIADEETDDAGDDGDGDDYPPTRTSGDNIEQDRSVGDIFNRQRSVTTTNKEAENMSKFVDQKQDSVTNDGGYEFDHNVGDQTFTVDTPPDFVETFGNKSSTQHGRVVITGGEDINTVHGYEGGIQPSSEENDNSLPIHEECSTGERNGGDSYESILSEDNYRADEETDEDGDDGDGDDGDFHYPPTPTSRNNNINQDRSVVDIFNRQCSVTGGKDFIMHVDDEWNSSSTSVAIRKQKELDTASRDAPIKTAENKQNTGSETHKSNVLTKSRKRNFTKVQKKSEDKNEPKHKAKKRRLDINVAYDRDRVWKPNPEDSFDVQPSGLVTRRSAAYDSVSAIRKQKERNTISMDATLISETNKRKTGSEAHKSKLLNKYKGIHFTKGQNTSVDRYTKNQPKNKAKKKRLDDINLAYDRDRVWKPNPKDSVGVKPSGLVTRRSGGASVFPCSKCGFEFYDIDIRNIHTADTATCWTQLKLEEIASTYCNECDVNLKTVERLSEHLKDSHDKTNTYVCKICSEFLANILQLQIHFSSKHTGCEVKNVECMRSTFTKKNKYDPQKKNTVSKPRKTTLQKKIDKAKRVQRNPHKELRNMNKTYKAKDFINMRCSECTHVSKSIINVFRHAKNAHGAFGHCLVCGKGVKSQHILRAHALDNHLELLRLKKADKHRDDDIIECSVMKNAKVCTEKENVQHLKKYKQTRVDSYFKPQLYKKV